MEKVNPLERFNEENDVEVFKPIETEVRKDESPYFPVFSLDVMPSNTVHGFDFEREMEGPKLPTDGLRSKDYVHRLREEICAEKSENM